MPGFNRQGPPNGQGNQSGRRLGKCNHSNPSQNDLDSDFKNGRGQGRAAENGLGNHQHAGQGLGRGQHEGQGFGRGQGRGLGMGRKNR